MNTGTSDSSEHSRESWEDSPSVFSSGYLGNGEWSENRVDRQGYASHRSTGARLGSSETAPGKALPAEASPRKSQKFAQWFGLRPGSQPIVTLSLIAVCFLVYIAGQFIQQVRLNLVFAPILGDLQPYRFLASAFVHAGIWHLVLNMYALYLAGSALEPAIGRTRFAGIYLLSAVAGNTAVALISDPYSQSWVTATVGASGAVFGVFGALFVLMRQFDANARSLFIVIVANLVLGFLPGMNISWESHVGGLLAGGVLMAVLLIGRAQTPIRLRPWRDVLTFLLALVSLVGFIFLAYR